MRVEIFIYVVECHAGYFVMTPAGNGSAAVCSRCPDNSISNTGEAADIEGCNSTFTAAR